MFATRPARWCLSGAALAAAEAHVPTHGALGSAAAVWRWPPGSRCCSSGAGLGTRVAVLAATRGRRAASLALRARARAQGLADAAGPCARRRGGPDRPASARSPRRAGRQRVRRRARCGGRGAWGLEDERPLERGDPIVVERVDGLTLTVRRAEEWEVAPMTEVVLVAVLVIVLLWSSRSPRASVRVLREYERAVVFRLGRLDRRSKGPGSCCSIPAIDRMVRVSLRTRDAGRSRRRT